MTEEIGIDPENENILTVTSAGIVKVCIGCCTQGNVYFGGHATSEGSDDTIYKYDKNGTFITSWAKTSFCYGLTADTNNFYSASARWGSPYRSVQKYYPGSWYYDTGGTAYGVAVDTDGNVYIAGNRVGGDKNIWKLNSAGELIWTAYTGSTGTQAVAVDSEGNVYVAGYRASGDNHSVHKFNSSGVEQWGFDTGDIAYGIAVDALGNVYVTGNRNDDDEYFWKLNSSGVEQWAKGLFYSKGRCVAIYGSYIYVGNNGNEAVWGGLIWYDSDGNRIDDEFTDDGVYAMDWDSDGYIYLSGGGFFYDGAVRVFIKADPDDSYNIIWGKSPSITLGYAVAVK